MPHNPGQNHDGESGLDYAQVAAKLLTMPNGLQVPNAQYLGAPVYGNTNFLVSVLGASGTPDAAQPKLNLYMIDSNSYSTLEPAVGGYGWPHLNQLSWLVNTSAAIKAAAAAGGYAAPPALAYQHIPLVQHKEWVASNGAIVGQFHEAVCSPDNDSGEFMQLLEVGDIKVRLGLLACGSRSCGRHPARCSSTAVAVTPHAAVLTRKCPPPSHTGSNSRPRPYERLLHGKPRVGQSDSLL